MLPGTTDLAYAPFGRLARVEGKVVLSAHIDANGKPTITSGSGHPVLVGPSKSMLASATFAPGCADHKVTITIKYRLRDAKRPYQEDSVSLISPGTYLVTGSQLVLSDPAPDPRRESWLRRLSRRIF